MRSNAIVQEVSLLLAAGYPLVYMVTREEDRAKGILQEAAVQVGHAVLEASPTATASSAVSAIDQVLNGQTRIVCFIPDLHYHLCDPAVVRRVRDLADVAWEKRLCLALVAPRLQVPEELQEAVAAVDIPLPSAEELAGVLGEVAEETGRLPSDGAARDALVRAAQGLTLEEAKRAFRRTTVSGGDVDAVIDEKSRAFTRTQGLAFRKPNETLDDVGGLDGLKGWLSDRARAFSQEARAFGLPEPRGLFLTGVQGCGKSLVSKATATFWRMPLLRLDLLAVFGSPHPEDTLGRALSVAEAMAPCVFWIDEVDRGWGDESGAEASRLLGAMLTWLQEKTAPVFAVATSNRVDGLPPELPRKGRFDDIFFVDLPQLHERESIFSLHISKRRRDPSRFDVGSLAKRAERFTGSEIEQAVISALYSAFSQGRDLEPSDLQNAIADTVPLADTFDQEIRRLREWAAKRARPASAERKRLDYFMT